MNLALIKKWITRWESTRFAAYDDKTGKPITPTTVLVRSAENGCLSVLSDRLILGRQVVLELGRDVVADLQAARAHLVQDANRLRIQRRIQLPKKLASGSAHP
jgi:hypothetical protein